MKKLILSILSLLTLTLAGCELLSGNIKNPITPEELYRAAASIVARWCNDVVSGGYASMYDVTSKLDALLNIYRKN